MANQVQVSVGIGHRKDRVYARFVDAILNATAAGSKSYRGTQRIASETGTEVLSGPAASNAASHYILIRNLDATQTMKIGLDADGIPSVTEVISRLGPGDFCILAQRFVPIYIQRSSEAAAWIEVIAFS